MVKAAKGCVAGGHATARTFAFFKNADAVAGLDKGSCGGDASHASTDDSDMFHSPYSTPS